MPLVLPGPQAAVAAVFAARPPPGIRRVPAQRLARRELLKAIYRPSLLHRILDAINRWLNSRLGAGPQGSDVWLIVLIVVAAVIVISVAVYLGPARRSRRRAVAAVLTGSQLSAGDHRRLSQRLAADGDFAGAMVERVRAIAVELESRGILLPRPGRTASELAGEAAIALPASAAALHKAARLFDDVRYGERAGTLAGYERVRHLDASIEAGRGVTDSIRAGETATGGSGAGPGAGAAGTGAAGTGMAGTGMTGTGLAGTGVAGTGVAGTGVAGPPR
jgi:hypothetical protein